MLRIKSKPLYIFHQTDMKLKFEDNYYWKRECAYKNGFIFNILRFWVQILPFLGDKYNQNINFHVYINTLNSWLSAELGGTGTTDNLRSGHIKQPSLTQK